MLPNKQKQRFPATPGTAVSRLCGNKDTACKVSEPPPTDRMFPLILVVTDCVITTFPKQLSTGWTNFVHPNLLTVHFEPLPPVSISVRTFFARTRLLQPLGTKWPYNRSALLGKQGVCIYKRSKRTSSVAAGSPFLLAGVAPQAL